MLIELWRPLFGRTPFFSQLLKPQLRQIYDLNKRGVCNSFYFTTSNRCGTHVDAPGHFSAFGGLDIAHCAMFAEAADA